MPNFAKSQCENGGKNIAFFEFFCTFREPCCLVLFASFNLCFLVLNDFEH